MSNWAFIWNPITQKGACLHRTHPWGGWRCNGSTGPRPCCRSRCGGPGCGRCCSPSRCRPARRGAASPPPWRGKPASATWDCGPTTGPVGGEREEGRGRRTRRCEVGGPGGKRESRWNEWEERWEDVIGCGSEGGETWVGEGGGRERGRRTRRLIFKHIHAWVIDVCSATR